MQANILTKIKEAQDAVREAEERVEFLRTKRDNLLVESVADRRRTADVARELGVSRQRADRMISKAIAERMPASLVSKAVAE